jgi:hypothetical protein
MAACIRCGGDTELYCQNIPVCPRCADVIEKSETRDQPILTAQTSAMASRGGPEGVKRSA